MKSKFYSFFRFQRMLTMMCNGKELHPLSTTHNLINLAVLSKYFPFFLYFTHRDVSEIVGCLVLQVCYQLIHVISKQSYSAHQLQQPGEIQDFTSSDYAQITVTTIFSLITESQSYQVQITFQHQFMAVLIRQVILPSLSSKKLLLNSMDVMKT